MAWGDWDLVSFDGALHVLPREGSVNHQDASYTFFMKYDADSRTWSRVAFPLDQMAEQGIRAVTSVLGTVYRGALVMQVTGTDAEPGEKGEPFGSYWRYNADGTWDYLPIELPEGQSLMLSAMATDGEHLYAFGGWGYFDEAPLPSLSIVQGTLGSIVKIDIDAGTATIAGLLPTRRANAHAAYRDGVILVSGGQNDGAQGGSAAGVDCVTPLAHDEERPSDYLGVIVPYPAGWLEGATVDATQVVTETGKTAYAVAACGSGFMLVGPRSDSGQTDTYTLEAEAGAVPRATGLNVTHLAPLNPAATVHDGMLYVLAATTSEPYRVFAAAPVDDLWEQGGEDEPDEPEDPSEGEAEDGKPGDTGDAACPGNSEDPGKPGSSDGHLAQTGDASMTYVIVLGALGCISLAAGRALRALRATRSSK